LTTITYFKPNLTLDNEPEQTKERNPAEV